MTVAKLQPHMGDFGVFFLDAVDKGVLDPLSLSLGNDVHEPHPTCDKSKTFDHDPLPVEWGQIIRVGLNPSDLIVPW